jgi:septal ring factor EnvC (AmiA/AmiB activator)
MKKVFVVLLAVGSFGYAQENIDSQCRVQAKEAAITTYQSCVKEARTVKIDEIRKEYQEKLTELKSYYDGELKKLSSSKNNADNLADEAATSAQPTIQLKKKASGSKNTAPKGASQKQQAKSGQVSTKLPAKKAISQTLPVQNVAPAAETEAKDISTNIQDSNEEKTFETEL